MEIQDVLKLLPSYSPEEQKTLRGIQDEIKQYTQSDVATEKDVATMRAEANALAAEIARLYSEHNPSLPPMLPMYACTPTRYYPPNFKPTTFSDAETCLRELLTLAKYVQEKKEEVAKSKLAENATKLKWKQADKAQELSNLFKEEADELCKEEESLQKEINALQVQCKDIETKLNPESVVNPGPPVPMTMHMVSMGDQAYFPKPTGHSSAWYAAQTLSEAMHSLKVQQDRVQKAKNKLPELQASKKEQEDRLRALKRRLEELNDKKRGAERDVDSATLAKKARAEANSS